MKFVGKTSVAVIKSAILGAFANELFFFGDGRESERREEEKKKEKIPAYRWDPYILRIMAKTIWALLINDISIAGSAKLKSGMLVYCPSLSPTRQHLGREGSQCRNEIMSDR